MIFFITGEREIHAWYDLHLSAGFCWKDHARVEFTFTRWFGHVSEAPFHYVWEF